MPPNVLGFLEAIAPLALAIAAAVYFDRRMSSAGLSPPAFAAGEPSGEPIARLRHFASIVLLSVVFWLGIFLPLTTIGQAPPDLSSISRAQLFLLHAVLLLTLGSWYLLGYAGRQLVRSEQPGHAAARPGGFGRQFGLSTQALWKDLGIGLAAGVGAWVVVLLVLILLGALIWAVGGEDALPQEPPALVPWIAALPITLRLALSASAGFFEEIFFRGFLQPRAGIVFSTVLFIIAHVGYGQPLMLVGVTLLSLVFAALVRWRQNIWSAVVAHAVFDALQLTIVIPKAMEFLDGAGGGLV